MFGIFLDIETNGLDFSRHCVLEIGISIVHLNTGEEVDVYEKVVKQPRRSWEKSDPESLEINGFTWEACQKGDARKSVGLQIQTFLKKHAIGRKNSVFICQNPSFDRAFFSQLVPVHIQEALQWPYHWLDLASMYWTRQNFSLWQDGIPENSMSLSKNQIAKEYRLPPEAEPHRAINGVRHLIVCYEAVVGFPKKAHMLKS